MIKETLVMKKVYAAMLCLCALLLIPACGSNSETGKSGAGKTLKLAFVTNNSADLWTIARRGVDKADSE